MKKKLTLTGILTLVTVFTIATACKNNEGGQDKNTNTEQSMTPTGDTIQTASGLKYIITKKGNGKKAEKGKKVKVHYTGKLMDGKVFDSSLPRGVTFDFELGAGQVIPGWDEGIGYLQAGDQATLVIPPGLGYGSHGAGGVIPPHATLIFDVELVDVVDVEKPVPFDVTGKTKQKTAEGLEYIVVQSNPSGKPARAGAHVAVQYTGYLENGTIFDSSIPRGQPISFNLGMGQVIRGWDLGIGLMKTGEKYRLIIPASLGYGDRSAGSIPPNSTLIFDVELISVQ